MALTKYKKSHEKIAMGLLSFMSSEQNLNVLQKTMQRYEEDPNWQLYLWKQEEDFIGVIGIELNEHTFNVHHACVNPSFRNEGVGRTMVEKVQELHEPLALSATPETKGFLEKCWNRQFS
jgi:riboflavin biosynthesis RibT protein